MLIAAYNVVEDRLFLLPFFGVVVVVLSDLKVHALWRLANAATWRLMLGRCVFNCVVDYQLHGLLIFITEAPEKLIVRNQDLAENPFSDWGLRARKEGDCDYFGEAEEVPNDPERHHKIQPPLLLSYRLVKSSSRRYFWSDEWENRLVHLLGPKWMIIVATNNIQLSDYLSLRRLYSYIRIHTFTPTLPRILLYKPFALVDWALLFYCILVGTFGILCACQLFKPTFHQLR